MWDLLYLSFYLSCELLEKFGYYSCDHFEKSFRYDYPEKWQMIAYHVDNEGVPF